MKIFNETPLSTGATNLRNLKIMKDLDQKFLHLRQTERNELKQLLFEYEHLFPDVPTKTKKFFTMSKL